VSYTGFVNGQDSGVLGGTLSFSGTAQGAANAGAYAITLGGLTSGNYSFSYVAGTLTINRATPTLTWSPPADIVYGTALSGTQLNATASVGGTFVYGPGSGIMLNAGNGQSLGVAFTPADTVNYNLANAAVQINVNRGALTVTANDQSRAYGATNGVFTAGYAGFVNGDGSGALNGALSFSCLDTNGVNVDTNTPVGTYPIVASGQSAANYNLTYVNGTLTITPANSTATLVSSLNPSPFGSNVTFTATLTPVSPATGTPSGSVQFLTNGVALGDPVTLSGGVAAVSTTLLPSGSNAVAVAYAGDDNFLGSSNSLVQVVSLAVQPPSTLSIAANGDGTVTVTFQGTPGAQYVVQASTDLASPVAWANVSTNTASSNGTWTFTESTVGYSQRFFRSAKP
jgi:hypothetical protein